MNNLPSVKIKFVFLNDLIVFLSASRRSRSTPNRTREHAYGTVPSLSAASVRILAFSNASCSAPVLLVLAVLLTS